MLPNSATSLPAIPTLWDAGAIARVKKGAYIMQTAARGSRGHVNRHGRPVQHARPLPCAHTSHAPPSFARCSHVAHRR
eukprot:357620-Chlamydomonas_euryale.AAC.4